jgi:hypothetical protein
MIELHPEILKKNGKDEFVVLPFEEFTALKNLLDDYEDLIDLRAAKEEQQDDPSISISELKREFDEAEEA